MKSLEYKAIKEAACDACAGLEVPGLSVRSIFTPPRPQLVASNGGTVVELAWFGSSQYDMIFPYVGIHRLKWQYIYIYTFLKWHIYIICYYILYEICIYILYFYYIIYIILYYIILYYIILYYIILYIIRWFLNKCCQTAPACLVRLVINICPTWTWFLDAVWLYSESDQRDSWNWPTGFYRWCFVWLDNVEELCCQV